MSILRLEGLHMEFPAALSITNEDVIEWLEFRLGLSDSMLFTNPLNYYELSDCNIRVEKCTVDGKEIKL